MRRDQAERITLKTAHEELKEGAELAFRAGDIISAVSLAQEAEVVNGIICAYSEEEFKAEDYGIND